jgi:hypothetical protein
MIGREHIGRCDEENGREKRKRKMWNKDYRGRKRKIERVMAKSMPMDRNR